MKKLYRSVCMLLIFFLCMAFCLVGSSCDKKISCQTYNDISYGTHERQKVNLCLPAESSGEVGLIFIIHGGGWQGGDKSIYDDSILDWCQTYGYAAAALNYRFISADIHAEDMLDDIADCLATIKRFAEEKGILITKALFTGSSAGGHLSLLYAYKYAQISAIRPVAVANYSGPTDVTDATYYTWENAESYRSLFSMLCGVTITEDNFDSARIQQRMKEVSPVGYVDENTVPTLICHGVKDDIVPYSNATILKRKLDEFGVKNDLITYENSGHSLGQDKKRKKQAYKMIRQYAKEYLG